MDITDVNETELDIYIMSNIKPMLDREYILHRLKRKMRQKMN